MRLNTAKKLLRDGKPAVGLWINMPSVVGAEALASVGWDWLTLDVEHGCMDYETQQNLFIAIGANGTVPLARIPENDTAVIKRTLDAGAYGVVVPMVCTAEEAKRAADACRYPPHGVRSAGGGRWRYWAGTDYMDYANDEILCIVMIEHVDAVARAEEILAVEGVDACFIGPSDLSWSMGLRGKRDERHAEAIQRVLEAGKKTGKPAGIHCMSPEEVGQRMEQGFQFLACQNDAAFMMTGVNAAFRAVNAARAALKQPVFAG
jgi:4-hydroxy-2-oxoheptanedioate aldolase